MAEARWFRNSLNKATCWKRNIEILSNIDSTGISLSSVILFLHRIWLSKSSGTLEIMRVDPDQTRNNLGKISDGSRKDLKNFLIAEAERDHWKAPETCDTCRAAEDTSYCAVFQWTAIKSATFTTFFRSRVPTRQLGTPYIDATEPSARLRERLGFRLFRD